MKDFEDSENIFIKEYERTNKTSYFYKKYTFDSMKKISQSYDEKIPTNIFISKNTPIYIPINMENDCNYNTNYNYEKRGILKVAEKRNNEIKNEKQTYIILNNYFNQENLIMLQDPSFYESLQNLSELTFYIGAYQNINRYIKDSNGNIIKTLTLVEETIPIKEIPVKFRLSRIDKNGFLNQEKTIRLIEIKQLKEGEKYKIQGTIGLTLTDLGANLFEDDNFYPEELDYQNLNLYQNFFDGQSIFTLVNEKDEEQTDLILTRKLTLSGNIDNKSFNSTIVNFIDYQNNTNDNLQKLINGQEAEIQFETTETYANFLDGIQNIYLQLNLLVGLFNEGKDVTLNLPFLQTNFSSPTVSYRKNAIIINGGAGQKVRTVYNENGKEAGKYFLEINALNATDRILFRFPGNTNAEIYYSKDENNVGKIHLSGFIIDP